MKCSDYVLLLSGHLDGENTKEQEAELKIHLNTCEECRNLLASMQENDRLLKEEIVIPSDLTKNIMAQVRKSKRNKKPFYISLAASGLAAAAALALAFGGKVTPQEPAKPQQTQAALTMRSTKHAEHAPQDFEPTGAGIYENEAASAEFAFDYAGMLQIAPTSGDIEKATLNTEIAALVIHAQPEDFDFEGTRLSLTERSKIQSKVDYKLSDNTIEVYAVSQEVFEELLAECDGVYEIERCYDEDVYYYNTIVIFAK